MPKTRICPIYFFDNVHKYLTSPEDISIFKETVFASLGWTNRDLWFPPIVKDEENGCLKGRFGSLRNWEIIADDLNKSQIPFLECFEFQYEHHQV
jgi:hypothetical protein